MRLCPFSINMLPFVYVRLTCFACCQCPLSLSLFSIGFVVAPLAWPRILEFHFPIKIIKPCHKKPLVCSHATAAAAINATGLSDCIANERACEMMQKGSQFPVSLSFPRLQDVIIVTVSHSSVQEIFFFSLSPSHCRVARLKAPMK